LVRSIPPGYALVPIEPTPAMILAATNAQRVITQGEDPFAKLWRAMVGAAEAPSPESALAD
jgi:hypothetical protein